MKWIRVAQERGYWLALVHTTILKNSLINLVIVN